MTSHNFGYIIKDCRLNLKTSKGECMIKKLSKRIREYKKPAVLAPVYIILESILEIAIPTLMALLIDKGISQADMTYIWKMGGILVACAFLSLVTGILAGRSAAVASAGFAKNLRHDMFYNVQNFSFSNIEKFSTASIITRLTTDVSNLQNAFQMMLRMGIRAPMILIFALIFSMRINMKMSMIFVGIIPVLSIGMWFIFSRVHPIFRRVFKKYDVLNNVVQENLYGIRVVKSFVREDHEISKFEAISKDIFDDFTQAGRRMAFNMPLMQFCVYVSLLLLSWFGAKTIVASGNNAALGLSTGELTSLITYSMQILMSLMMLSMIVVFFIISRASAERVVELLDEESDLTNGAHPIYEVANGSVDFENVTFFYQKKEGKPVLDKINLSIKSGETIGIIGGTGSAKSSMVQLIPRLYDVVEGSIKVAGIDVRDYDIETLRDNVAMVLQKNILFSGTIKDNLRWGNENATEEEMIEACKLAQAHDFISSFEDQYDSYIEQGGSNVSGGQRQRLCIARALLKTPKILILDDSTSAVDTSTEAKIRQGFRDFIPDTTKIIIAQRITSVMDADKIIVMDDGKISAMGKHEDLMQTSEIYKEVYESQNKGGVLHE